MKNKPTLLIISDDIRKDLHGPLSFFYKVQIVHLYRLARYQDMSKEEFVNTIAYKDHKHLYKLICKIKPDIIQAPEPWASRAAFFNTFAVIKYHKKYKTPFIYPMFENLSAQSKFGKILGLFMKWYLGYYSRFATFILALNNGAKRNLLACGVSKNKIRRDILWATWGVDTNQFKPNWTKKTAHPSLFFVGKVEKQKGILNIIEAYKKLKKQIPNLTLEVAGSGSLVKNVTDLPDVRYLGIVKNKLIHKYFQKSWITLAPSISSKNWIEQVGMANIQSIACGTPVITTTSGAIPEYMPNKIVGYLVPENNSAKLTYAILRLLDDEKLRINMSRQAYRYALEKYDARKNIQKAQNFILDITGQNK